MVYVNKDFKTVSISVDRFVYVFLPSGYYTVVDELTPYYTSGLLAREADSYITNNPDVVQATRLVKYVPDDVVREVVTIWLP